MLETGTGRLAMLVQRPVRRSYFSALVSSLVPLEPATAKRTSLPMTVASKRPLLVIILSAERHSLVEGSYTETVSRHSPRSYPPE